MLSFNRQRASDLAGCLGGEATERVLAQDVQLGDVVLSGGYPFVVCARKLTGQDVNAVVTLYDGNNDPSLYYVNATPTILKRSLRRDGLVEEAGAAIALLSPKKED